MKLGARSLNPMEEVGILVAVMVMGLYGYLHFIQAAPSRKMQRMEAKYEEVRSAVGKLARDQESGRMERVLLRLQRHIDVSQKALREVERSLAEDQEKDALATMIFRMASEKGFIIQDYSHLRDPNSIREIYDNEDAYDLKHYAMTLQGRFGLIVDLLRGMEELPRLVAVRKILVDMPDDGSPLRTEIWFSL